MPLAAECAITMLMQVTADDQAHAVPAEFVEQLRPNRRYHAGGTHDIVGWTFQEERLVQEQSGGPSGGTQLLVEPLILCLFPLQARAEKLRVDTDQAPVSGVKGKAIGGKRAVPSCEPICIDDLVRVLAGWLVADVVVARQG